MSEPTPAQPSVAMEDVKLRSVLIMGTIAVFASIIFGLLYLFVLAPAAPGSSAGWFLFAFATGITMIVMPCTLPLAFVIVPLSMGKGVAKGLGISLAFGFGIAVTQSMYGVIAAIIGSFALGALGAPLESVKNWVYLFAGIFALLFALGEIGLIKVRMPTYTGAAPAFIQRRQDMVKAFLLGLFLGNIGIGCPHPATPLLLIEAASSGNIAYGWLLFMTHAIGRVLPLLLLSFLGILGVNGLSWLMSRKESVERATGWAMVYVAGFILTLGLFTHDWWVNSGIHSALEKVTNEQFFNQWFNNALNTAVVHVHGLEVGTGMFGLPLWLGNWFLVSVWVVPMWWWWARKRKALLSSPAFRLREIESRIDRLEKSRRELEEVVKLDDVETDFNLTEHRAQIDSLEKIRREAEERVQFAEKGILKEPLARSYESKILAMQRNYLVLSTAFLALIFIYFLPTNFYLNSMGGGDHHGAAPMTNTAPVASDGHTDHAHAPGGAALTPFSKDTAGLPEAKRSEVVTLEDGDTYSITASYVQKRVGNRTLRMMAYNGSVPGPFIYASQGARATINFKNQTDIDQTIHSHGLRLDNASDGTPGVTQAVVKPGESYTYTVSFPDAGIAWYHPHTRDDIGQELGLYGNYIIDPADGAYYGDVNRDAPLVIDDILLEGNTNADFYKETVTNALLGRFGNTFLVNGEENYAMPIKKGEVMRFFVTNVSNARTYNLMIPGAEMKVVGADLGRFEKEYVANSALISPAERLVIEVYFKEAGNYRLTNATPNGMTTLATFAVSEESVDVSYRDAFNTLRTDTTDALLFSKIRDMAFAPSDKRLRLTVDPQGLESVNHDAHQHAAASTDTQSAGHMMPDGTMMGGAMSGSMGGMMKMGMAGMQWDDLGNTDKVNTTQNVTWKLIDEESGKANADIDLSSWTFKKGSLVKIALTNDMMAAHVMQHPIHLHGQRFVELSRNGVVNQNMVWKDTLLVLPGEKVEIVADMSNTGVWMLHCHIVEHLFAGMMMSFRVEEADGTAAGDDFRNTTPAKAAAQSGTSTAFSYTTPVDTKGYSAVPDNTTLTYNKLEYVGFTFLDAAKNQLKLSSNVTRPLTVTFVKSDGSAVVTTYPGKSDFTLSTSSAGHIDAPGMPPHMHSFLKIVNVAQADAGHPHDPAMMVDAPRTYTVPVVFTSLGSYRGFVEYVPDGETVPRVASFDVTVTQGGFSVDSLGWSKDMKWWVLLIVSLLLMAPLVWWVRRYINAAA